jgi:sortase A
VTVTGVLGELLVTAGVLVFLFLGWQLWLNDIIVGSQQTQAAQELAQRWATEPTVPAESVPGEPVVLEKPQAGATFANLIIPRLGADYRRSIAEGTGHSVLSNPAAGIGHYGETQMPGAVGNFAVAAHRTTYGAPFHDVENLVVGDSIFVETADGWYRYVYRTTEYVRPTGVGVLEPVPQVLDAASTDRIITLTSCHPLFSAAERIISYGVFDTWYPRDGGPPAEIATLVQAGA